MITKPPHFLLYSESTGSTGCQRSKVATSRRLNSEEIPPAGWHFVLRSSDGTTNLDVADHERGASAERLELLAVVRGLEALEQPSRVTLVTSSGWIRHGLRFGLDLWRENRWQWERFGRMAPVKNADLWRRIDRALQFHEVECRARRWSISSDDLARPVPQSLTDRRFDAAHDSVQLAGRGKVAQPARRPRQLLRRLFSWCRMCRSAPSLLIATH